MSTTSPPSLLPTTRTPGGDVTPRGAAVAAGTGIATLFVLALAATLGALEQLVVADDPGATLAAIAADPARLRLAIVAFAAIVLVDVLVAWALHVLLRPVAPSLSLLAAWLRLVYAALLGVALAQLVHLDALVAAATSRTATLATEVDVLLAVFDLTWQAGLLVFGAHLVAVGLLLARAGWGPRPLRGLLVLAGAAYVLDALLHLAVPGGGAAATVLLPVLAGASVGGEGWLAGWLLVRGGRAPSGGA